TLEWIAENYQSPVDGRVYVAEGGWTTFGPAPRAEQGHRPLSRIVLLKGLEDQTSGDALGVYLNAIEREFSIAYGDRLERVEVFLRVEISPGEPARVTERSDNDDVCVAELVERVPLPPVTGGVVAFECCLTNRPDGLETT